MNGDGPAAVPTDAAALVDAYGAEHQDTYGGVLMSPAGNTIALFTTDLDEQRANLDQLAEGLGYRIEVRRVETTLNALRLGALKVSRWMRLNPGAPIVWATIAPVDGALGIDVAVTGSVTEIQAALADLLDGLPVAYRRIQPPTRT